jgi:hypothetical protein
VSAPGGRLWIPCLSTLHPLSMLRVHGSKARCFFLAAYSRSRSAFSLRFIGFDPLLSLHAANTSTARDAGEINYL